MESSKTAESKCWTWPKMSKKSWQQMGKDKNDCTQGIHSRKVSLLETLCVLGVPWTQYS